MAEDGITIVLPLVVGTVIGFLEAYFVYEDENMTSGREFLKDLWHGLIFSVLGVIVASNVPFVVENFIPESFHGFLFVDDNNASLVVSSLIAVFMFLKMVVSHHALKGASRGFKEKAWHKLAIALLVGFAPYYIVYLREPLEGVATMFPDWIPF